MKISVHGAQAVINVNHEQVDKVPRKVGGWIKRDHRFVKIHCETDSRSEREEEKFF